MSPIPGFCIMCSRFPIVEAVLRSEPPAGMSGWCMCNAIEKPLRIESSGCPPSSR